jgi:hypothetical protein
MHLLSVWIKKFKQYRELSETTNSRHTADTSDKNICDQTENTIMEDMKVHVLIHEMKFVRAFHIIQSLLIYLLCPQNVGPR